MPEFSLYDKWDMFESLPYQYKWSSVSLWQWFLHETEVYSMGYKPHGDRALHIGIGNTDYYFSATKLRKEDFLAGTETSFLSDEDALEDVKKTLHAYYHEVYAQLWP